MSVDTGGTDQVPAATPNVTNVSHQRDLWMFVAGYAYSGEKAVEKVMQSLDLNAAPEDIANLIGGIQKRSANMVHGWMEQHGVQIEEGLKVLECVFAALTKEWKQRLVNRLAGTLQAESYKTPEEYASRLQEVLEIFARNGIKVTLPKPKGQSNEDSSAS